MPVEIVPGVYQLKVPMWKNPLGGLNAYLIRGGTGHLLVDTGWNTEEAFDALTAELKSLNVVFDDIRFVIITHVHPDHYGLAGRLRHNYGTRFAFHLWEKALIETRYIRYEELMAKIGRFMTENGVPHDVIEEVEKASLPAKDFVAIAWPDEILYGGETISIGPFNLEVIWTPGHSPGHVCLYEPSKGLLFAGDHILPGVTPNIGYHLQSGSNPLGEYLNSLRQLRKLNVTKVLPAHQQVFESLPARIDELLMHHEQRNRLVLDVVSTGPATAYSIASEMTWKGPGGSLANLDQLQQRFAVMETMAHLEYLRMEGVVQRTKYRNLVLYRAA